MLGGVGVGSVRGASVGEKNITKQALNGPFLNGLFPGDFQEGKRPIKAFGGRAQ